MAETTRIGLAVQKTVAAVQEELDEIAKLLEAALAKIRTVEVDGKGINGLAGTMKGQGNQIAESIKTIQAEAESVAKKMLHEPRKRHEIREHVDQEKAAEVSAARAAS